MDLKELMLIVIQYKRKNNLHVQYGWRHKKSINKRMFQQKMV